MDIAVANGLGQGLRGFVGAYQTALNYQLEKSRAANLAAYQQQMADAATKNAATGEATGKSEAQLRTQQGQAAVDNSQTEKANARVKYLELGDGVMDYYAPSLADKSSPAVSPQTDSITSSPASTTGLMVPKAPGFLEQPEQKIGTDLNAAKGNDTSSQLSAPQSPGSSRPQLTPVWMRGQNFELMKEGLQRDPKTGQPTYAAGPLGDRARIKDAQGAAQLEDTKHGSRSAEQTINNNYNADPAVIAARSSSVPALQVFGSYKNPSPYAAGSMTLNAFNARFAGQPGAANVNTIAEFQKSGAVPDRWKNTMQKELTGNLSEQEKADLVRDTAQAVIDNHEGLQNVQNKYLRSARAKNISDLTFMKEDAADSAYKQAQGLLKNLGPYVAPGDRPDSGIINKGAGLISSLFSSNKTAADSKPSFTPDVMEYAKSHGISNDQALSIKMSRTGKK